MKNCKNCNECKPLYRKGFFHFWKQKLIYCVIKEELTQAESYCENWKKKKPTCNLSDQRFDEVENDIKLIGDYIKNGTL